jgi:predicted DCC family thiol-disulfide oxidoreductase YuxK
MVIVMSQPSPQSLTCFHDGECPICRIEINAMKKLDHESQKIKWVDISKDKQALASAGLSYQQAMSKMYVIDNNKGLQSGVDAFLLLWAQLPYYRRIAVMIERVPFFKAFLGVFYRLFAKYRLKLTGKTI